MKKSLLFCAFALCFLTSATFADSTPVVLSLIDPVQYPSHDVDLSGLRLGGFSRVHKSTGLTIGIVNMADAETCGLQLGCGNILKGDVTGVVLGQMVIARSNYTGFFASFFGRTRGTMTGMNLSLVSVNKRVVGLQAGLINFSQNVRGVQLGVINAAEDLYGVQIGLLNFVKNGNIPLLPIVNMKF